MAKRNICRLGKLIKRAGSVVGVELDPTVKGQEMQDTYLVLRKTAA